MELENKDSNAQAHDVPEIRQNLVDTAVEFLNMDKILSQPDHMKRQFLLKKGLSNKEIEMAFSQSKSMVPLKNGGSDVAYGAQYIPSQSPVVYVRPSNFWTKLRDVTNAIVFLSGIVIGFKYLYKHYIGPYLTGKKPVTREESLLQIQKSVVEVLQQIEVTLERINRNILEQNQARIKDEPKVSVEEMKTELSTIKTLLINKKSFPAAPAPSPSIPLWQKLSQPKTQQPSPALEGSKDANPTSEEEGEQQNNKGLECTNGGESTPLSAASKEQREQILVNGTDLEKPEISNDPQEVKIGDSSP